MKKVLITGSSGVIGSLLSEKLPYDITGYDLPESDVLDYHKLRDALRGQDVLIHLAWNFTSDGWLGDSLNPDNALMSQYALQAAQEAGVKRVIMASSVHADKFAGRSLSEKLLEPHSLPTPDSPYGAGKCMLEALSRYYAESKRIEVVCIRFGGVNKEDKPPKAPHSEREVWFSERDCVDLVEACIEAEEIDRNYTIVYGVSDNEDRLHDYSNPFGWKPKDSAPKLHNTHRIHEVHDEHHDHTKRR